jgi:hypothetical protein
MLSQESPMPAAASLCQYSRGESYSIGYERDDGDFCILATLNNHDEDFSVEVFDQFKNDLVAAMARHHSETIVALKREDTPDYVNLQDSAFGEPWQEITNYLEAYGYGDADSLVQFQADCMADADGRYTFEQARDWIQGCAA